MSVDMQAAYLIANDICTLIRTCNLRRLCMKEMSPLVLLYVQDHCPWRARISFRCRSRTSLGLPSTTLWEHILLRITGMNGDAERYLYISLGSYFAYSQLLSYLFLWKLLIPHTSCMLLSGDICLWVCVAKIMKTSWSIYWYRFWRFRATNV